MYFTKSCPKYSLNEPYMKKSTMWFTKEPYAFTKEPYAFTKEPYAFTKELYEFTKCPTHSIKEQNALHKKPPCIVLKRAICDLLESRMNLQNARYVSYWSTVYFKKSSKVFLCRCYRVILCVHAWVLKSPTYSAKEPYIFRTRALPRNSLYQSLFTVKNGH